MNFYVKQASAIVFLSIVLLASSPIHLFAQGESVDKVLAIVGRNRIILQSDIELQALQAKQQDPANYNDSIKCFILQQMILKKLMVEQGERDSIIVSDEDVDAELNNRIRYFTQMYGSKEKLEQASGKTIYQMKEEYKDIVKEDRVSQRVQSEIFQNVKITPAEVNTFFQKIPQDSLPFFPASVEIGQIVIDPPVSLEVDAEAHKKLEDIRKRIVEGGESFEKLATFYSDDPGSRDNGGRYDGIARNGPWVPEFLNAVFKLQNGEISPIVKTKFGYHIIQMITRKGDEADVRHILVKPALTTGDFKTALNKLDSVRAQLISGKITFPEAVGKYATDDASKRTGGMVTDPSTGASVHDISKLDPGMVLILDSLQPGSFSQPQIYFNDSREKSCRIIYLKSRTAPHKANLRDDYNKIQEVALEQKKMKKMEEWVAKKLPTYYIKIDPDYQSCAVFKNWGIVAK